MTLPWFLKVKAVGSGAFLVQDSPGMGKLVTVTLLSLGPIVSNHEFSEVLT